jgi:hypothetical protein
LQADAKKLPAATTCHPSSPHSKLSFVEPHQCLLKLNNNKENNTLSLWYPPATQVHPTTTTTTIPPSHWYPAATHVHSTTRFRTASQQNVEGKIVVKIHNALRNCNEFSRQSSLKINPFCLSQCNQSSSKMHYHKKVIIPKALT